MDFESDPSICVVGNPGTQPYHFNFPISERGEAADAYADGPIGGGCAQLPTPPSGGLQSRRLGHSRGGRGRRRSHRQPRGQPRCVWREEEADALLQDIKGEKRRIMGGTKNDVN